MQPFFIPASTVRVEETIKKSRFFTYIAHTPGLEAAKAFVSTLRLKYPDARHHCWACVAGAPHDGQQFGFSDDGEPSGTAGKPMLAVLQGSGLGELTAVSVRYFGGIKLGTGGLVKAYASGVKLALAELSTCEKVPVALLALRYSYPRQNVVEQILAEFGATVAAARFGAEVFQQVEVDIRQQDAMKQQLVNRTQGDIQISQP